MLNNQISAIFYWISTFQLCCARIYSSSKYNEKMKLSKKSSHKNLDDIFRLIELNNSSVDSKLTTFRWPSQWAQLSNICEKAVFPVYLLKDIAVPTAVQMLW